MVFAETERLRLRAIEKSELPRLTELLDVWDVVRWLTVVPYPYTMQHAEEFFAESELAEASGEPQFYAIAFKSDDLLIGGVGLHPPRGNDTNEGEIEIGYWLGRDYWGRGFMSEAARAVVSLGFARKTTGALTATTALNNVASQNVLLKLGLRNKGLAPRDYPALRGDDQVVKWQITRKEWQANYAY
jgi:RimJ/RimL family protein N-acetyltransferase